MARKYSWEYWLEFFLFVLVPPPPSSILSQIMAKTYSFARFEHGIIKQVVNTAVVAKLLWRLVSQNVHIKRRRAPSDVHKTLADTRRRWVSSARKKKKVAQWKYHDLVTAIVVWFMMNDTKTKVSLVTVHKEIFVCFFSAQNEMFESANSVSGFRKKNKQQHSFQAECGCTRLHSTKPLNVRSSGITPDVSQCVMQWTKFLRAFNSTDSKRPFRFWPFSFSFLFVWQN